MELATFVNASRSVGSSQSPSATGRTRVAAEAESESSRERVRSFEFMGITGDSRGTVYLSTGPSTRETSRGLSRPHDSARWQPGVDTWSEAAPRRPAENRVLA